MEQKSIELTILGEPIGKSRPRVTRYGAYTPAKTKNYEVLVKETYALKYGIKNKLTGELEMEIKAYYKIPKSTSKRRKELMLGNRIRPTKKPDLDNVIKVLADSLNSIAYDDDSQIVRVVAEKYYSDDPRVEVIAREISDF